MITVADAEAFARCIEDGGVAVFPADTVYGLACHPENRAAVDRLYELKGRPPEKPAAVMFFDRDAAFAALPGLGSQTRSALEALLPGGVTALLANPGNRFPLACGPDPGPLGLRVPALTGPLAVLASVGVPVLQSSANHAGGADARRVQDVPEEIRSAADVVLDGGDLPGTPSTVVDLRRYEDEGRWAVVRAGAVGEAGLRRALG